MAEVLTIGHSNAPIEHVLVLPAERHVELVVDMRSVPRSRIPQFNALALDRALRGEQIGYASFGTTLDGRPEVPELYDAVRHVRHVRHGRLAATAAFTASIARLEKTAARRVVAILCAEEAPDDCHRHLLIGRVLASRGVGVGHLCHDGTLESYQTVVERTRPASRRSFVSRRRGAWCGR